jgi:hypothetical protein
MICTGCNQEHDDNQVCPNCSPQSQVTDPKTSNQPGTNAVPESSPANGAAPSLAGPAGPTPAGAPPETTGTDPNVQPADPTTQVRIDITKSNIAPHGDSIVAGVLTQIQLLERTQKVEEEKSLHDSVKQLTSREKREYRPREEELQKMVQSLLKDRLILLSSSFAEYALDAAWEVIEALPPSPTRIQSRIAFEDTITKDLEFSLQKLCEQRSDVENETVTLVDALHSQADTFPTSILGNSARIEAARQDLKNSKLFLVVVVNHEYATEKNLSQRNLSYKSFSYWNIPFVEPFFQHRFPDHRQLLAEITKQCASGKWEESEAGLTQQIINYYVKDVLREIINNGGPKDADTSAQSLLKAPCPVEKAVLYTATFFNEITSPEFCRVVESLLGNRTMLKSAPGIGTNGSTPASAQIEVPLRRIWDEKKDDIFTELLVETSTATDSPRTVSLSEFNLAEPLRKLFETRHRFYVMDQFKALQQTGIFFYPSLRLAKNTTQLAVDLAQLYPDEFNEGWIVTLVMRIREHFATDASDEGRVEDPMFYFLSNTQPGAFHVAFARVSEICQRFLKSPHQKNVVPNSLEYLMKNSYQQEVLWLVKQLKFNPEFDDWYWLKQLLNRGDLGTKYLTYYYILSHLKELGTRVYEGLKRIEEWLPPSDRSKLTDFDTFNFRILIKYCLDTIARFNEKHYGKWPSRYALFTRTDEETANARFASLTKCLLHPGVDRTLVGLNIDGTRIDLIGILLAEWSFILLGTPSIPPTRAKNGKEDEPNDEAQNCTASQMFDLLLKHFLSPLNFQQRLELLKYWTQYDSALLILGSSPAIPLEKRNEWKWKKTLVQRLIRELKLIPAAKPSRTNSPGPIVTSRHA